MIIVDNRAKANPNPLFSIVTSVLNAEATLEETILSVANQSFKNFEFIVIDGGSTDSTIEIIKKNSKIVNICLSEPDNGLYHAFNKGLEISRGTIIGFLNGDDTYNVDTLLKVSLVVPKANIQDCIVYGGVTIQGKNSTDVFFSHQNIAKAMISHPATFVSSSVYRRLGNFDTSFKVAADYEFIARCFLKGIEFIPIMSSLANYRPGGYSDKHWIRSIYETVRVRSMLNTWNCFQTTTILTRLILFTCIRRAVISFKSFFSS